MDMPRFHFSKLLTIVTILVSCSVSVRSEDLVRQEAAIRLKQAQIERLEDARLIAEKAQRDAKNVHFANVHVGNDVVVTQVHHIDHLVYGTTVLYGQQQIENQLANKVQQLSSEYDLTEAQQAKLLLATQCEAKLFLNEVDVLRQKYNSLGSDLIGRQIVLSQAQSLNFKRRTLFGPNSFSSKVMAKTVTGDQLAKYQSALDERLRIRHRSNIEGAIRDLERHVVLKIAQTESLVELLISEIPPPKLSHDYDETLVKYQFSQISEQKLRLLFDEGQWPQVRQTLDGFHELETALVQQGLIQQEGAAASKPATNLPQNTSPTDAAPIDRNRAQQVGEKR
ncbi:MAG: hypothetical protein WCH39_21115 [Schlesneria sp.]